MLLLAWMGVMVGMAQPVQPTTRWLATVDSTSGFLTLGWSPSATPSAMGYHICSGMPCLSLDTVYGRMDTTYVASSLPTTEQHRLRLHVFDSAGNVSALTPFFGAVVLRAAMDECDTTVQVEWSPYVGMQGGVVRYDLLAAFDNQPMRVVYSTDTAGALRYALPLPRLATAVDLHVATIGMQGRSLSNHVHFERATADTARHFAVLDADYDSAMRCVSLHLDLDTAFHASPYRLLLGWNKNTMGRLATVADTLYADCHVNPYDTLRCYALEVADACGLNVRRSEPYCILLPPPPTPLMQAPNCLVVGDGQNGLFLPRLQGLMGDLYELHIYNRMGLLVFSTTNPNQGWNPQQTNSPQGVYTYALRVRYINNQVSTHVGTITVIR